MDAIPELYWVGVLFAVVASVVVVLAIAGLFLLLYEINDKLPRDLRIRPLEFFGQLGFLVRVGWLIREHRRLCPTSGHRRSMAYAVALWLASVLAAGLMFMLSGKV